MVIAIYDIDVCIKWLRIRSVKWGAEMGICSLLLFTVSKDLKS